MPNLLSADVLLVEDNPQDAELTMRALRRQGLVNILYHVGDGEQALDFIFSRGKYESRRQAKPLKVVLLDLKLPKVSGLEVLVALKSNPETACIPVVIVSSSREDPDISKAYELGANSYVVKPVHFEDFMKAIEQTGLYWLLVNEQPSK